MMPQQKLHNATLSPASFITRLVAGVLLLNLFVAGLAGLSLQQSRVQYQEHAANATQNLAHALEDELAGIIEKHDIALLAVMDEYQRQLRAGSVDGKTINAYIAQMLTRLPRLEALRIADSQGTIAYSSAIMAGAHTNISDHDFFVQLRNTTGTELFISKPLLGLINQKQVVAFSRRLSHPDGSFAGVAFALMTPTQLGKTFSELDVGKHGTIALFDSELQLLTRYSEGMAGDSVGVKLKSPQIQALFKAGKERATYVAQGTVDGFERTYSYKKISKYPIYILVGQASQDYLAEWKYSVVANFAVMVVLFLLTSTVSAWLIYRSWKRRISAVEALAQEETKFQTVADFTYNWEYWLGPDQEMLYISPSCERITGYTKAEFLAQPDLLYLIMHPEDHHLMECHLHDFTHADAASLDFRVVRRDGKIRWISHCCQVVYGKDGQFLGRRVSNRDISENKAAEDELRKFSTAIEQGPASIVITNLDGTIEYVNPRFVEVTGYERDEAIGCNPRILQSGLTPIETYQDMWQSLTSGLVWHGELVNKRKNGELYWEEVHLSPVKNAAGATTHYVGVKVEITERKRTEKALRENEARFRYMLETSPIAVRIASTSDRRVLFANQRYAELIESQPDEVMGVDPKVYYTNPEDYEDIIQRLSLGENVTNKLIELRIPGGAKKWALASYLTLEYGNESAVLGWFYDITERKSIETALRASESRLTTAQHIAHVGNWELDLAKNKLWWSEEIFRIFEIDPKQFKASYEAFLAAIHPDDRDAVNQAYSASLENKAAYEIDHRLLFQDGRIKYVHENCDTEFDADGKPLRSMGTVQDITERKLTEMALQRSEATSRALINATSETAILLDESGTVIAINEVGAHRLRGEQDEIVGRNFYALLPPDLAQSRQACARQVFQSGKAAHLQDVRDGIHFNINVYPVFDNAGKVMNLAIYAADITEQIQLQGIDQLFHGIDQQVLRGLPMNDIFAYVCAEVTRIFGYQYAWIGRKEADGSVSISAGTGPASNYREELERIGVRWDDTPEGKGPTGTAIRTGQPQVFKLSDSGFQPWHEAAERHRLNAILGLPLIIRGEIYGAFTLYSQQPHDFDTTDVLQRLSGIASRICVALETATDQQQLMLLRTALSATANGVFITDKSGHILWVNKAFTAVTGYEEREALGATPRILSSGNHDSAFYKQLWQEISRGEVWRNEMADRHKDGSEFFVRQTITPILDSHGNISHFIAILEDISAEKEAEARIEHMAHYDSLTQLPNRALFLDRLRQSLSLARRSNRPAALMFLDLDRFKSVNDTLGHHAGDLLLQQVAARLKACVRESDTVARLAGDEFTVLLPDLALKEDAVKLAEKIIAAFAIPFDLEGHTVSSSTSIGIALFPKDADDEEGMLKRSDAAMYVAKEGGRNKYAFFE